MQLIFLDVGQDEVLLVRDANFAEAVAVREIGNAIELRVGRVTRREAGLLEGQRNRSISGTFMAEDAARHPAAECAIVDQVLLKFAAHRR
jgi:hypothetical protein